MHGKVWLATVVHVMISLRAHCVCISLRLYDQLVLVQAAISMLKQEYKEPPTLKEALQLAIKILNKTLDSTKLNAEKGTVIEH